MKTFHWRDFLFGAIAATALVVLLGATASNNNVGRYAVVAGGDVVFAEPRALIGFAGPRTIKATIKIELPKGFQTSEFLLEHGFIDRIVPREKLKTEIAQTIDYCGK